MRRPTTAAAAPPPPSAIKAPALDKIGEKNSTAGNSSSSVPIFEKIDEKNSTVDNSSSSDVPVFDKIDEKNSTVDNSNVTTSDKMEFRKFVKTSLLLAALSSSSTAKTPTATEPPEYRVHCPGGFDMVGTVKMAKVCNQYEVDQICSYPDTP